MSERELKAQRRPIRNESGSAVGLRPPPLPLPLLLRPHHHLPPPHHLLLPPPHHHLLLLPPPLLVLLFPHLLLPPPLLAHLPPLQFPVAVKSLIVTLQAAAAGEV